MDGDQQGSGGRDTRASLATEQETSVEMLAADDRDGPGGFPPGSTMGRYIILERVGAGGMGVVFSAYDPELDRRVALKVLHEHRGRNSTQGHDRLLREARAMAQLSHPNVITVHDAGSYDDMVFLAMEFIDGQDLRGWLRTDDRGADEVLDVFIKAGRGLAAAHARGIIHRDFKPENVMLGKDGRVRVMDFGIARVSTRTEGSLPEIVELSNSGDIPELDTGGESGTLTRPGAVIGTPAYMSPEQHAGLTADERSDQFSYCVALYEALHGERPYRANSLAELALKVTEGEMSPPPENLDVPREVTEILHRGLASDPDRRWPSMDALLEAFARLRRPTRSRTGLWLAAAAAVLSIGVGSLWLAGSEAGNPCDAGNQRLVGIWDADRSRAVHDSFAATGLPYADDTVALTVDAVDAYANSWLEQHRQTCEATHVHGEQSGELLDLRMACLERRLESLDALATQLSAADPQVVESAIAATETLPPLERCADAEALRSAVPPPDDPDTAATVTRLRKQLDSVTARAATGQLKVAQADGATLLARAEATNYEPLIAEVLVELGDVDFELRERERARERLERAFDLARKNKAMMTATIAATRLAQVVGYGQREHEAGLVWARVALADMPSDGSDPVARGQVHTGIGNIYQARDEFEKAIAEHERAIEFYEGGGQINRRNIAISHGNIGNALQRLDRFDESRAAHEKSLGMLEEILGPRHPQVARTLTNLASACMYGGDLDAARMHLERALEIRLSAYGEESEATGDTVYTLANLDRRRKDFESAEAGYRKAMGIYSRAGGPDSRKTIFAARGIAIVLQLAGDQPAAIPAFEQLLERYERNGELPIRMRGDFRSDFAETLWLNDDRDRALEMARRAREDYVLGGTEGDLARIDEWIESRLRG